MSHPTEGFAPCNACTSGEPQQLYDGGLCATHYAAELLPRVLAGDEDAALDLENLAFEVSP